MTVLQLLHEFSRLVADAACAELRQEPEAKRLQWLVKGAAERAHCEFLKALSAEVRAVLEGELL